MTALYLLLVEDNPTDVLLTEDALSSADLFRMRSTSRLAEALRFLSDTKFDLVLLDLGLPDSQGLATLRRVRQAAPKVALVVLTGQDDEELALQALHEGADDYVVKQQADGRQLRRAIRYAVELLAFSRSSSPCRPRAAPYNHIFSGVRRFSEPATRTHNPNPRPTMSIDKSLKRKGGMTRPRCVLTRAERITKMMEDGKWNAENSPFGLPKTRVQKIVLKKKAKKEATEGEAGAAAPGAAAATPAAGAAAKPAAGGKK